jgi:hypothetical protein
MIREGTSMKRCIEMVICLGAFPGPFELWKAISKK